MMGVQAAEYTFTKSAGNIKALYEFTFNCSRDYVN
ncbi:hypothetical protein QE382_003782 [Sphingobacterium zeae]|uniref:Uncharacterized protein n=1 Tax=Sphingobacterium zeae TaxID=1776859 RepID=A0ABU0UAD2_9SPHI|nr:hypothetical protein [Sphingobacterium zeae]